MLVFLYEAHNLIACRTACWWCLVLFISQDQNQNNYFFFSHNFSPFRTIESKWYPFTTFFVYLFCFGLFVCLCFFSRWWLQGSFKCPWICIRWEYRRYFLNRSLYPKNSLYRKEKKFECNLNLAIASLYIQQLLYEESGNCSCYLAQNILFKKSAK